jgi:nitronate monooxygenase
MFIVSGPELVIAQFKAGIVGDFPFLNARLQEMLEQWLSRIRSELDAAKASHPHRVTAPFAVNLIVHNSNERLKEVLATCIKYEVPIIITSLRALDPAIVEQFHAYGGVIFHDVISIRLWQEAPSGTSFILIITGLKNYAVWI